MKENNTYRLCAPIKHSERRKGKEKAGTFSRTLWLMMTYCHDVVGRVRSKLTCLLLHCYVLCAQRQFCYTYDWLKVYQNLGWAPKHSGRWWNFTTTLIKPGACSVSSALRLRLKPYHVISLHHVKRHLTFQYWNHSLSTYKDFSVKQWALEYQ